MAGHQLKIDFEKVSLDALTPEDIYDSVTPELLKTLKEDRRFERKRAGYNLSDLGNYFSMWANTSGGGLIAIGIENNGDFSGWRGVTDPEYLNKCENCGHRFASDARYRSRRIPFNHSDGTPDFILLFYVEYHATRVVRTSNGHVYVRRADNIHELNDAEIRSLENDKGQIQFEQEDCNLNFPGDFDIQAIHVFANAVKMFRPELEQRPDLEVLCRRHLGRMKSEQFIPNHACALLFAKEPRREYPGCLIRFMRFDGKEEGTGAKYNAVKDEWIEGTIPQIIDKAEKIVESQLRSFSRLDSQQKFTIIPEYPKDAWYEAIVNAMAHRQYGNGLKNVPVFIKMFDHQLVIDSPGAFPPFVSPENIFDMHHPRNPKLMEALYHLKLVKCANEGTRRMRDLMRESKLPDPLWEQEQKGYAKVRVVLRNNVEQRKVWVDGDVTEIIGAALANMLDEHQKRIVNYVAEHNEISVSDVQRMTGLSWPAARKRLDRLVEINILEHVRREDLDRDPQARYFLRKSAK